VKAMAEARNNGDLEAFLSSLSPSHHFYRALKQELEHYRNIADSGGWSLFPSGKTLHPGEIDIRVPDLRGVLAKIGDLVQTASLKEQLYDDQLVAAVKRFQLRNGLEVDGIVGKGTTAALRIPVERRIRQILMNMERWRWTKHDLGTKYVLVDIAGFALQGVTNDYPVLEMRVIVGKLLHETPIFSDSIKYIDFNPFWNITPSIARNEMLEKLREDDTYLAGKHIKLFSSWQADGFELDPQSLDWNDISRSDISGFKLRQEPGVWNALGVMKFVFPNKYSIYLHDTPSRNLFEKSSRAFSHGCIRISAPQHLAQFLLKENDLEWTEQIIQEIVDSEKRKVVRLKTPVPVHMVYQTAWVDKNGLLHFNKDIYGRDEKLGQALFVE
jgi:murein L,D-transpeptidase YcbB/YkuD